MRPEKKRLALRLLLHTVILAVIYFLLAAKGVPMHLLYVGCGAILALVYVIYNRGLAWKNATEETLPDSMSLEEKRTLLRESRERLARSEWILTLVLPMILTLLLDYAYLFLWPFFAERLS
ncbi:MAG: hypothetical protein IKD02_05885 [Clostridia bacterium]|nr:hypothetical protein [Clostridia bacterium]